MSFTQAEIVALRSAIASGALEVEYADGRRVKYRSLAEMRSILEQMVRETSGNAGGPRVTLTEFTRD